MTIPAGPHVDSHIGLAIKARRRMLGCSQVQLADDIGVTFQQVQKYERGQNRVSSSTLYAIAHALRCPVVTFFEGLPATDSEGEGGLTTQVRDFMAAEGGAELARIFVSLPPDYRKALRMSARAFAESLQRTSRP